MRWEAIERSHRADQPETGDAALLEQVELLVGDLVEAGDGTLVFLGQLVEPDIGVLGDQDQARHPVLIGAEALVLGVVAAGEGQAPGHCRRNHRRNYRAGLPP